MRIDIANSIPLGVGCRWRSVLSQGHRKPRPRSITKRIVLDGLRCQQLKAMKTASDIRQQEAARKKKRAEQERTDS